MTFTEQLIASAVAMGITVTETQAGQFETYHNMLTEANKTMNLTRVPDDIPEAIARNYLDCIAPLAMPGLFDNVHRMVDVGTGAGFPGIPIAIMRPDINVILLDSLKKRLGFLQTVIDALHLNAFCVHDRAEDGARKPHLREGFDLATARAVAAMPVLSEYLLPYVKVGGKALCYKGPLSEEELTAAARAVKKLGGRIEGTYPVTIPERDWDHRICVLEKIHPTAATYPRKAGTPIKNPL